jgi:hypothetical protein
MDNKVKKIGYGTDEKLGDHIFSLECSLSFVDVYGKPKKYGYGIRIDKPIDYINVFNKFKEVFDGTFESLLIDGEIDGEEEIDFTKDQKTVMVKALIHKAN